MILPTKHVSIKASLIGQAALLMPRLRRPRTLSRLWDDVRRGPEAWTYERLLLALDLLYMLGMIEHKEGLLTRVER